jgi:sterol 3beta-glucosyltransferase
VQPYLALAVGLQQAGHTVTLATSYNYTEWIQSYGVQTHPTHFSVQEFMRQPEVQAVMQSRNFVQQFRLLRRMMRQGAEAMDDVWTAIQHADFVIQSPTSSGALEAAQTRGLPVALAYPVPFAPTRAFPSFFIGAARFSLGAHYNRLTHALMHRLLWSSMSGQLTNALRKKLGLPTYRSFAQQAAYARSSGIPSLYGFSEHVIPRPADWDEWQHITGYWFLEAPADWHPAPELLDFLASGPPPVYLGFGSINLGDADNKTRLILRAGIVWTARRGSHRLGRPHALVRASQYLLRGRCVPRLAISAHGGSDASRRRRDHRRGVTRWCAEYHHPNSHRPVRVGGARGRSGRWPARARHQKPHR